jgi:hypothetical protein
VYLGLKEAGIYIEMYVWQSEQIDQRQDVFRPSSENNNKSVWTKQGTTRV